MLKNVPIRCKNYKHIFQERDSQSINTKLEIISKRPIEQIIPEFFLEIQDWQRTVDGLATEIERINSQLTNTFKLIANSSTESLEIQTLKNSIASDTNCLETLDNAFSAAELKLYELTSSNLSKSLGIKTSIMSQATIERQQVEKKYLNFDKKILSTLALILIKWFSKDKNPGTSLACIAWTSACFKNIFDPQGNIKILYGAPNEKQIDKPNEIIPISKTKALKIACEYYSETIKNLTQELNLAQIEYRRFLNINIFLKISQLKSKINKMTQKLKEYSEILIYLENNE